ncbi:MAG: aminotransferase class V-fold PLP-dependent enzyme [Treponema sp.]|jgi:cysteine desulfurase|nr:aminotransferase class V-fold PLP-dependent enzyme [Treponema sp.]
MVPGNSAARCYFDWAATAIPDSPSGRAVPFGNPSSPYREGREAREVLEEARRRCAVVLGVKPETLYFTSGGTEANAIALHSNLLRRSGGRILASAAEHPSVGKNFEVLRRMGKETGLIPVESLGMVSPGGLKKILEKYGDSRFAAVMAVNNETGAVTDMAALRDVFRNRAGAPVHIHCDLVQAVGKIVPDIPGWDLDSASLSAHKIGGPRGVGILYLRRPVETVYAGGAQEGRVRPGTENTAGALALAEALENHALPEKVREARGPALRRFKKLIGGLGSMNRCVLIPPARGEEDDNFSPYILQAAFRGIPGEVMVRALDDSGFAVSTGSACSSASAGRPVLEAMGIEKELSLEGIRISQGWSTTDEETDLLLAAIEEILKFL